MLFLLQFWLNKDSLGEHKRLLSKTIKIVPTLKFAMVEAILTLGKIIRRRNTLETSQNTLATIYNMLTTTYSTLATSQQWFGNHPQHKTAHKLTFSSENIKVTVLRHSHTSQLHVNTV